MSAASIKRGFTLIELVLSMTFLGILIGLFLLYNQSSQLRADLNSQTSNIVHYLRLAQSSSASGLNDTDHGLHLEDNSYTLFEGSSYNESNPDNFVIDLPPTLEIESVNLHGGGDNIIFTKPNGETTNYGTFSVVSTSLNESFTITVTDLGTINY